MQGCYIIQNHMVLKHRSVTGVTISWERSFHATEKLPIPWHGRSQMRQGSPEKNRSGRHPVESKRVHLNTKAQKTFFSSLHGIGGSHLKLQCFVSPSLKVILMTYTFQEREFTKIVISQSVGRTKDEVCHNLPVLLYPRDPG